MNLGGLWRQADSRARLFLVILLAQLLVIWLLYGGEDWQDFHHGDVLALIATVYTLLLILLLVWFMRFHEQTAQQGVQLARQQHLLRSLLRTLPDMIWMKGLDGRYLFCNAAFERLYGAPEARIVGHTAYEFVSKEKADSFHEQDLIALESKRPVSFEEELTYPDTGQRILSQTIKMAVRDEKGSVIGILGVARDITFQRQAEREMQQAQHETERLLEEANHARRALLSVLEDNQQIIERLHESNALLSAFIKHSPIYAFIKTVTPHESRVVMASENFRDLAGIPGSQMTGKSMAELFPAGFAAKTSADDWRVVTQGEVLTLDEELNGRSYITVKFPVQLGSKHYLAGYTIDITARKQAEDEVRRLNAELEQRVAERTAQLEASNKELEAFSYSVSHDLRAPLRAISGFITLLDRNCHDRLDAEGQHYLEVIAESATRMGKLIDAILTFSRLGRSEMHWSPVDLNPLLQEVLETLRPQYEQRRIEWKIQSLPTVEGERTLLGLVLQNLLGNALKFTARREVAEIEVGVLREDGREVVCYVKDNGAGFDMRYADKLFQLFQRLHSPGEFEGTGVGLAHVQRIIQRHGGKVWADSRIGEGATFYFALPKTQHAHGH